MGLQTFFAPVSVIVEELGVRFNVLFRHQDETRFRPQHNNFCNTVRYFRAVVHKSAVTPRLGGSINTEKKDEELSHHILVIS